MPIKAVFFDMDGTLVYPIGNEVERLMEIYHGLGLPFERELVEKAYELAEEWWKGNVKTYLDRNRESFIKFNRVLLEHLGVGEELDSLAEKVQYGWEASPDELYPEVKGVLEKLKRMDLKLGVISGRYLSTIKNSLKRHGILRFFSCLVSPFEASATLGKLDLKLWQFASQSIGARTEETAHVGDDPETDIAGAERAGVLPILIDRKSQYRNVKCLRITDLIRLPSLLEERI